MRTILPLILALTVPCCLRASPQISRPASVIEIEGMEPITDDDLSRFTALAMRLADASRANPTVVPMLEETLAERDRGIVKRSVAYLALVILGKEEAARARVGATSRDQAVMTIVRACLTLQESLTEVPAR